MEAPGRSGGAWIVVVVTSLLVAAFLFEGLFLDRSLLGIDNRLIPPFGVFKDASESVSINFATSDINGFILPETYAQRRGWAAGQVPLWNPWQNLGQPLLADMGFAPFYPTAALALFLEPLRAYAWSMALHLVWMSLGMFWFLRRRGSGRSAAVFGGVLLSLSGFASVHLHLPHFVRVMAWFPWFLLCVQHLACTPTLRRTAVTALVVGAMLLAAFPQLALWGVAGGGCFFLFALAERRRLTSSRSWCTFVLALILGGALSAIHLAPTQEALDVSLRPARLDDESYQRSSLSPIALLGAVSPRFLSWPVQEVRSLDQAQRIQDWPPHRQWLSDDDQDNAVENTLWVGLLPLLLVSIALCRRPRGFEWWAVAVVCGSLLVAMGVPGLSQVVRAVPGLGVGAPKRVLVWTTFGLCLLAARGLDELLRTRRRRPLWWFAGLALLLFAASFLPFESRWFPDASSERLRAFAAVFLRDRVGWLAAGVAALLAALSIRRRPTFAAGVLVAVTGADLVCFGRDFNPSQTLSDQYRATAAIDWLCNDPEREQYRVLAFQGDFVLGGNFGQVFGFQAVNGVSALLDRRVGELLHDLDPSMVDLRNPRFTRGLKKETALASPLLDLLGVRHLVVSVAGNTFLEQYGAQLGLERVYASEAEQVAFWRRPTALPRAFLVPSYRVIEDPEQRREFLCGDGFVPAQLVVLEETPLGLPTDSLPLGPVRLERPRPERVELHVEVDAPALLVFTETANPGWTATVDGDLVPILHADHAFQAVALPAGARTVVFEYDSPAFHRGRFAAVLAGVGIMALLLLHRRKPPRVRDEVHVL